LEEVLRELGPAAHVYVGTGLGAFPTIYDASVQLNRAQRRWDRFWANPERCEALAAYRKGEAPPAGDPPPTDPDTVEEDSDEREVAERAWNAYWTARSSGLAKYLEELAEIESITVAGEVEAGKLVMSHLSSNYDRTGFQQDANVVFPIDRLRELADDGLIGSIAQYHYAFMGAARLPTIEARARQVAGMLKRDAVDAVLLTPV
jgi:hypothetical protein